MRKVKFNMYVQAVARTGDRDSVRAYWQKDYPNEGLFHAWGFEADEEGTCSVGIIELPDGTIKMTYPERIKFIDKP